jgi:phosphoribosyl 1,2-cyclic phosphodiesterase
MLEEQDLPLPRAIVVTHAHQDHVGEAPRIAKRLRIPLYFTRSTAKQLFLSRKYDVRIFSPRETFAIGGFELAPLPVPHDAAQIALTVSDGHARAGIVTDLGEVPPGLPGHLAGCDVLLVESNHDLDLLDRGPYPEFLKQRVRSARGHLSNLQTHALLRRVTARTHTVVLLHLSRANNREDLALECARDALPLRVDVHVAPTRGPLRIDASPQVTAPVSRQLSLFAS